MCVYPFIFTRSKRLSDTDIRHESIHGEQQKEMLLIGFYLWYGMEWVIKLFRYRNGIVAYKNISFEREAYSNQDDVAYLDERKPYAFIKYLTKNC